MVCLVQIVRVTAVVHCVMQWNSEISTDHCGCLVAALLSNKYCMLTKPLFIFYKINRHTNFQGPLRMLGSSLQISSVLYDLYALKLSVVVATEAVLFYCSSPLNSCCILTGILKILSIFTIMPTTKKNWAVVNIILYFGGPRFQYWMKELVYWFLCTPSTCSPDSYSKTQCT
jgi:hypothetical protein